MQGATDNFVRRSFFLEAWQATGMDPATLPPHSGEATTENSATTSKSQRRQ
ncbi:MAG: hypothetical protein ACI8P0_000629 [Planctomycetaceae bacterium]